MAERPNEIDQDLINSELEDNPAVSNVMLAEKLGFSDHAIRNQLHAMGSLQARKVNPPCLNVSSEEIADDDVFLLAPAPFAM